MVKARNGPRTALCLTATIVVLLVLAVVGPTEVSAASGVKLYANDSDPGQLTDVFMRCETVHLSGNRLFIGARTTDDQWRLGVHIHNWQGLHHPYLIHFGSTYRSIEVDGLNGRGYFSTRFAPAFPTLGPAGSVRFSADGAVLQLDALAPNHQDNTKSVLAHGSMKCHAPR
jgi:hypothetical protein